MRAALGFFAFILKEELDEKNWLPIIEYLPAFGLGDPRCRPGRDLQNHSADTVSYTHLAAPFMEEYRARNIVPGRDIFIVQNGEKRPAHAEAITDDGHLLVTTAAGREELSYGEVSIRFE